MTAVELCQPVIPQAVLPGAETPGTADTGGSSSAFASLFLGALGSVDEGQSTDRPTAAESPDRAQPDGEAESPAQLGACSLALLPAMVTPLQEQAMREPSVSAATSAGRPVAPTQAAFGEVSGEAVIPPTAAPKASASVTAEMVSLQDALTPMTGGYAPLVAGRPAPMYAQGPEDRLGVSAGTTSALPAEEESLAELVAGVSTEQVSAGLARRKALAPDLPPTQVNGEHARDAMGQAPVSSHTSTTEAAKADAGGNHERRLPQELTIQPGVAVAQSEPVPAPRIEAVSESDLPARDVTKSGSVDGATPARHLAPVAAEQPAAPASVAQSSGARPADSPADVDLPRRVVEQVVREATLRRLPDRTDLVIRLSPPELGSVRLRIVQDAGGITSHIQTSTEHVRSLLQAHVPMLTDALAQAGIRVDAVSVTSDTSSFAFAQGWTGEGEHRPQDNRPHRYHGTRTGIGAGVASTMAMTAASHELRTGYSWLA